jgi:23S rRNA (cytosine1962-C5)-methyltransferase
VQTSGAPLADGALDAIAEIVRTASQDTLTPIWNHRPAYRREGFEAWHPAGELGDAVGREEGMAFAVDPRHGGMDPLLFLDLRAGRRRIREIAAGKRVLNLFAYTCGIAIAAAKGGAREIVNVDFARSALSTGARNAVLNGMSGPWLSLVHEDVFPIVRQYAGLPIKGRGARRPYLRVPKRSFDLVALDPPRWAKTPFGAVDVARDYPSLLKPAISTLERGGLLFATNHVASIDIDGFAAIVRRSAEKIGRRIESLEAVALDPDAAGSPLKIVLARVD